MKKQEDGEGCAGDAVSDKVAGEGSSREVTMGQGPGGTGAGSPADIWGIPGKETDRREGRHLSLWVWRPAQPLLSLQPSVRSRHEAEGSVRKEGSAQEAGGGLWNSARAEVSGHVPGVAGDGGDV